MNIKTIEKIQYRVELDAEYQDDLNAYQNIVDMAWELPSGWQAKDWIRKQISTDGHDAVKTATNIYDTNRPKWEILPRGIADKDRAEELEAALIWWMQRANKLGETEPFRKALHHSVLQNRVIYQLEYLPYWLPAEKEKWTKEQKAAMKASSFCITVHDARNVYFEMGKYGLQWVASVTLMPAQDVINHWQAYANENTEEGRQIKKAISQIEELMGGTDKDAELNYIHVDYTDYNRREVAVFATGSEDIKDFSEYTLDSQTQKVDILDAEYKLPFINWVVVTGDSTPLLYSLHKAGLWENQNLYNTLTDSVTMRRAVFPILKHTSPTGKELEVDYTGEQDVIELQNGEQADTVAPPPLDPAMSQISSINTARISQATGIKGLASIEIAGNVQYAAVQAVIQMHMTSLVPYVRTAEKANAQLADMAFMWIKESGKSESAYRTETKGQGREKGNEILITPDDFDPDDLFIECKLIANTFTDKQQRVNMLAQLKQAGAHISWKEELEKLGYGNAEVLEADWLEEEIQTIALQQKVKELDAQLQLMIQAQQMQMQQAQQMQAQQMQAQQMQQSQMQAPPDQSNPMMPTGGGFDANMGGQPTAEALPAATSPVGEA